MRKQKLSPKARQLLVTRLGWVVDDLHHTASVWQGQQDSPERAAYREAADAISDIRKEYQR